MADDRESDGADSYEKALRGMGLSEEDIELWLSRLPQKLLLGSGQGWDQVVDRFLDRYAGTRKALLEMVRRLAKERGLPSDVFEKQVYVETDTGKKRLSADEADEKNLRFFLFTRISARIGEECGFRISVGPRDLDTARPSPLATIFYLRQWERFNDASMSVFLPVGQQETAHDNSETAQRIGSWLEKQVQHLEDEGFTFDKNGRICYPQKPMGRAEIVVNGVIRNLYAYLSKLANLHSNDAGLRRSVQDLLRPMIDVDDGAIRGAVRNLP